MEKKLEVKNLRISFKTANGKVQAVRNINFELNKGETLAIVGESGSGKSVTSKSMLGILAGNAIIESGEIIYDGRDLLKISEDEFYRIRGDKIAMIFQDPMSSLNPIMRIGKQLTEAMILKGKARQKASRDAFNTTLELLNETMIKAIAEGGYTSVSGEKLAKTKSADELTKLCKDFDAFEFKHIELEQAYNEAKEAAVEAISAISDVLFHIEKNAFSDEKEKIREIVALASKTFNEYVVNENADQLKKLIGELKSGLAADIKAKNYSATAEKLSAIKAILDAAIEKEVPNFFRMGYYLKFSGKALPEMPVAELNEFLLNYLNENFMLEFLTYAEAALKYSALVYAEKKKEALAEAAKAIAVFSADGALDKKTVDAAANELIAAVEASIDRLEINKDSIAYTFHTSLNYAIENYFNAIPRNAAAQKAHDK